MYRISLHTLGYKEVFFYGFYSGKKLLSNIFKTYLVEQKSDIFCCTLDGFIVRTPFEICNVPAVTCGDGSNNNY